MAAVKSSGAAKKSRAAKSKPLPFNQTLVLNQWVLGLFRGPQLR